MNRAAALLALSLYASAFAYVRPHVFRTNNDFECFYRSGRIAMTGGNPYDLPTENAWDRELSPTVLRDGQTMRQLPPFVFSPISLLVFDPLAHLQYKTAEWTWFTICALSLIAAELLLARCLNLTHGKTALLLVLSPFFMAIELALMQGQPVTVTLLFLCLFWLALRRNEFLAGAALACASIKPQYVVLLLAALCVVRAWSTLAAYVATSAALLSLSALLIGWKPVLLYPLTVLRMGAVAGGEYTEAMPNLRGLLYQGLHAHIGTSNLTAFVLAGSLLLVGCAFWLHPDIRSVDGFAFLMLVTLAVSYHAYLHDMTLLLITLICFWRPNAGRGRSLVAWALFVILLLPLAFKSFAAVIACTGALLLGVTIAAIVFQHKGLSGGNNALLDVCA